MPAMDPRDDLGRDDAGIPVDAEADAPLTYDPVDEARHIRAREAAAGIPGLEGFALVVTEGRRG